MKAALLRIYLSENDKYKGKAAHHAVLEFLRDEGIAGATVHHCMEGYGIQNKIHTASVLRLGTDLPVIIQAVDKEEKIRNIIPELKKILPTELITLQEIEIVSGDNFRDEI
ncbi:DUF190 domain-containing protein [Methanolobus sp. ZRKC2]|uniref:DUF190 domain-containing protein n=1 Tax=Methanolobus sp. ZRKC2 TaxID=3125783 RepID=UPI003248747A